MDFSEQKTCIIFDLGGVLLNIDYQKTSSAFGKLGAKEFDLLFTQAKQNHSFDALEKGQMSAKAFRDYLREITGVQMSDFDIDHAWNSMLLDFPIERLLLLEQLKSDYFLILMSNTNSIHLKAFRKIIEDAFGMARFERVFHKIYYSSEIGKRKPDAECFKWILDENNLQANVCVFIDDSIQHIESAERVGIQSLHLTKSKSLNDIFHDTFLKIRTS